LVRTAAVDDSEQKLIWCQVYGQQADDRGSKGGPYNEADEPAI
jgi:hypothetical protein